MEKVAQIAKLLGVSCDYLLDDEYPVGESAGEAKGELKTLAEENNCITELLKSLVGRRVRIAFYDDEEDFETCGEICRVEGFEGNWMRIHILKKKETREKLIALSSVLSFEILEEEA